MASAQAALMAFAGYLAIGALIAAAVLIAPRRRRRASRDIEAVLDATREPGMQPHKPMPATIPAPQAGPEPGPRPLDADEHAILDAAEARLRDGSFHPAAIRRGRLLADQLRQRTGEDDADLARVVLACVTTVLWAMTTIGDPARFYGLAAAELEVCALELTQLERTEVPW